jgi:hypothetical protein
MKVTKGLIRIWTVVYTFVKFLLRCEFCSHEFCLIGQNLHNYLPDIWKCKYLLKSASHFPMPVSHILESKYGQNSHKVLHLRMFANTYEFENSHLTCKSHFMQILSHNSHRQKALTFFTFQSKLYEILRKDTYRYT